MKKEAITEKDRILAKKCLNCFLCKRARQKQRGLAFWLVKKLESGICPACKVYEKVYNRKAHEPLQGTDNTPSTK